MTMTARPLTIRERQERKKQMREAEQDKVRVKNVTRGQPVPLQIYGKESRAAVQQTTLQIGPGRHVDVPKYRLIEEQISNLKKRKMITVHKVGAAGKEIKDAGYKQFLPGVSKKDLQASGTRSNKGPAIKASKVTKTSSSKKPKKSTKPDTAE